MLFHDQLHRVGPFSTVWFRNYGDKGVDLFFAISGILICTRLCVEEAIAGHMDRKRFYIRRLFRIQPPALVFLLGVAILWACGRTSMTLPALAACVLLYRNYFPFHGGQDTASAVTHHFWSLSVEEHFYLLLPTLLVCVKKGRALFVITVIICGTAWAWANSHVTSLSSAFDVGPVPNWRTDLRLNSLLVPALFAILLQAESFRSVFKKLVTPLTAALFAGAAFVLQSQTSSIIAYVLVLVAFPLLILGTMLHPNNLAAKVLEWRPLRYIGQISYSIYLWQQIFFFDCAGLDRLGEVSASMVRYGGVLIVASLSYYLVEKPMMRIGHRLAPAATPGRVELVGDGPADSGTALEIAVPARG